MKRTIKKSLALMLSALMVISILPAFAITASAAVDGNSSFLTDSTKTDIEGTATWNSTVNAWEFDGSKYLKISGNPLAEATVANGFSVSFDVYHNDVDEASSYYFYFTDGGSNSFHMKAADKDSWWERYITRFRYNGTDRNYYTSDFDSTEYCDPTGSKMNDIIAENQWYNIRITMETDGCFSYYIDGMLVAKFRNNYASLGNGHGVTDENVNTVIQSLNNMVIGAKDTNGTDGFRGYIKNFRFNSLGSDADSNYKAAVSYYKSELDAIAIGTSKNNAYDGLADLYDAYVDLNEAYDAYKFGGSTSINISDYAMDVFIAGDSITKYVPSKGTAKVSWSTSGTNNISEENNDNILYANPAIDWNVWQLRTGIQGNVRTYIYYPHEFAIQYDGINTTLIPVAFGADKNNNNTNYIFGVYPTKSDSDASDSEDFALTGYWWSGYEPSTNYDWEWHWTQKDNLKAGYNYQTGNPSGSEFNTYKTNNLANQDNAARYYNIMKFIGTPTATLTNYHPTWLRVSGDDSTQTAYTISDNNNTDDGGYDNNSIYVLNLAKVREAVAAYQNKLASLDIEDYKQGGLSNLFGAQAIDNALALTDLNSYFASGTFSEKLTAAQSAIDNVVNSVNALSTDFASVADTNYAGLRTAIIDYADINNNDSKYTAASFSAFETAYGNAAAHMAALPTSGYNAATAGTLASALNTAYGNLVENVTVNFINAANQTVDTRVIGKGSALETLPANTLIASTDTSHHNVYTWGEYNAESVITADTNITESVTETACAFTAGAHTDATDALNGYTTYSCTCGNSYNSYDALNFDAYTAAVADYNTTINAADYEATYTAESRADYAAAVEAAKLTAAQMADETLAPKVIADAAQAITDAKSNLELVPVDEPEDTYNLTITDDIDINFNIDTEYQDAEDGYIIVEHVEINENEISTTTTTDRVDAAGAQTSISMAAIPAQLAEPYVITVYNKDGDKIREFEQSVQDYCNAVINSTDPAVTEVDKEVAKGLLDYGAAASEYFNYADISETDNYAVSHADDYDAYAAGLDVNDIKAKATVAYTEGKDASGADLKVTGISYLALTEPEFRFYVSQTNDVWCYYTDLSIEGEGLTAEWAKTDNGNCVIVKGLKASDFAKSFTLTIGTTTLTYNGYAFLYTVLRSDTNTSTELDNLAKGVYRYAAACEAKFA